MRPFPVILSAPSGGGKTTIARALLDRRDDLGYSVSCTTRDPRPGERHGNDYYFLSRHDFLAERERDAFAESAEVHGRLYGTLRREIDRVLGAGRHVMMDIDVQGAGQFVRAFPDSVTIFILPPSADVLLDRLKSRKTETAAQLESRFVSALHELENVGAYDYVVVNDDLEHAIASVSAIIDAEAVRRTRVADVESRVGSLVERLQQEITNTST